MSAKSLLDFDNPGPQRITLYYCKSCEQAQVAGNYAPSECTGTSCTGTDFWSEFDDGAPCNRHEEEENAEDDETQLELFFDGEQEFELKRVA